MPIAKERKDFSKCYQIKNCINLEIYYKIINKWKKLKRKEKK